MAELSVAELQDIIKELQDSLPQTEIEEAECLDYSLWEDIVKETRQEIRILQQLLEVVPSVDTPVLGMG